ncbi:hypothetical protein A0U87_19970 [Sphingobium sp. MP9-4]|nr:hypothetical protein A0U87_19970 [Sphingobium sp. MP9-4]
MAVAFLAVGVGVVLLINRRVFNRRNVAGVQEFSSYGHSLLVRIFEMIGRIAAWLFILAGIGGILSTFLAQPR